MRTTLPPSRVGSSLRMIVALGAASRLVLYAAVKVGVAIGQVAMAVLS